MKKKLFWVFAALIAFLATTPVALYLLLPSLISPLLENRLTALGCQRPTIKIRKIGARAAEIEEIRCALPNVGDFSLKLVKLSYGLRQLYGGNLAGISVANTSATFFPSKDEQTKAPFLPDTFFRFVPVSQIQFDRLEIHHPLAKEVTGRLTLAFHALSAEGELELAESGGKNKLKAAFTLSGDHATVLAKELEIHRDGTRLWAGEGTKIELAKSGEALHLTVSSQLNLSFVREKKKYDLRFQGIRAEISASHLQTDFDLFYGLDQPASLALEKKWKDPEMAFLLKPMVAPLAKAWPLAMEQGGIETPLKLIGGNLELAANGRINLGGKFSFALAVTGALKEVDGAYGDIIFEKLSFPINANLETQSFRLAPATLTLLSVDPGYPLKNIKATVRSSAKNLASGVDLIVRDAEVDAFSGKVRVPEVSINSKALVSRFQVQLEGLKLGDIVALQKQEDISASGLVDGILPVEIKKEGILMRAGEVKARAPGGRIAYSAGAGLRTAAEGNPGLKLAVDALENFQYQVLEGKADYETNGDLSVALRIEGKNPDWSEGRPVHFNLTIQENIPVLLRSLRIAKDTEGALERLMQKK